MHIDRFFRNFTTPGKGIITCFKNRFWDAAALVEGAGTGAYVARFLLKGGILAFSLPAIAHPPVSIATVFTVGLLGAAIEIAKLYRC